MAGYTPNYHLAFFDFGDRLTSAVNIQREIDRFTLIDKQLYGLYYIFGDGVINGWQVLEQSFSKGRGISVAVSSGAGIIRFHAATTNSPRIVNNLPPNSTVYIYARQNNVEFSASSNVSFVYSSSDSVQFFVKLAKVVTNDNGIEEIDNLDRDYILMTSRIDEAIAAHKHRGSPTKIDLNSETKNTLTGAKIAPLGSGKITSGSFDLERVPIIDHNDLTNIGVLSHAAIDTYINNFALTNENLLGEVAAVNRARQTMYIKYLYPTVDDLFVNEINFIPGVSPDSDYDAVNTTATVDKTAQTIAGLPQGSATAYFFTKAFDLPDSATKCFITSMSDGGGSISYGINMNNSVDFDNDYELLDINSVNSISGTGTSMRIGIKLISPADLFTHSSSDFSDYIDFEFENASLATKSFHFRIKFYTDLAMTNLYYTAYSLTNQTGWLYDDTTAIPAAGLELDPSETADITYYPSPSLFTAGVTYYFAIDIWDGSSFSTGSSGNTFSSSGSLSDDLYHNIPRVNNFTVLIELENNQKILLNT